MSSLLDVRLGAQEPVILHLPPDVHSLAAAEEAIELADAYLICDGNPLAESQKITLRAGLGERVNGSWAASRVADFGPRQGTGKNDKINGRELAGLVLFGEELIIHTAHEFQTANESFLRLLAVFEAWDDLRRLVRRVRYANGEQGFDMMSGQRLKYRARTGGSGRGFAKADLIVYDEAQHLARSHVAASGPAKLANPNSQTWYAGSGGFSTSAVAWDLRRAAILGTGGRLAYTEMTAERITVVDGKIVSTAPDPADRDGWYACMPGLGRWVTEEAMEAMHDELGPDFPREGQCVWEPEPEPEGKPSWDVFDEDAWGRCNWPDSQMSGTLGWSLDVAPGSRSAAVSCSDGTQGEVVDYRAGTDWVVARLLELREKHGFDEVALDANGPAGALLNALEKAGIPVRKVTITEHAQACGDLLAHVDAGTFVHIGQEPLNAAAAGAAKRTIVDVWLWTRSKAGADICPLVAVTLARWFALTLREDGDADFFTI